MTQKKSIEDYLKSAEGSFERIQRVLERDWASYYSRDSAIVSYDCARALYDIGRAIIQGQEEILRKLEGLHEPD